MRIFLCLITALSGLALSASSCARSPDPSASISIAIVGDHYEVTVPVGHATLVIPRGQFEVGHINNGGSTSSPRYFLLEDKASGAIVSGWFESARGVKDPGKTLQQSWPVEAAGLSKSGMAPYGVENEAIDSWQSITYGVAVKEGSSRHIRATQVVADTWVDLHLSVTRIAPEEVTRAEVTAVLRSLTFKTR